MKKIRLVQPHTHAGQSQLAGDVITVSLTVGEWLVSNGVGEFVDAKPATKKNANVSVPNAEVAESEKAGDA